MSDDDIAGCRRAVLFAPTHAQLGFRAAATAQDSADVYATQRAIEEEYCRQR